MAIIVGENLEFECLNQITAACIQEKEKSI